DSSLSHGDLRLVGTKFNEENGFAPGGLHGTIRLDQETCSRAPIRDELYDPPWLQALNGTVKFVQCDHVPTTCWAQR
ncbi:MAG: hypothetical protein ACE5G0_15750, partial [Rhodothermales bacterium]